MNADIFKGKWHQLKGSLKEKWGDLTDDEITRVDGNLEKMAGLIQEKYGKSRKEAEREIDDWMKS